VAQQSASDMVLVLKGIALDEAAPHSARIGAAHCVFAIADGGLKTLDLEQRITDLEKVINGSRNGRNSHVEIRVAG
jgi:hypothetical protein